MVLFRALIKIWVKYRWGGCLWLGRLYTEHIPFKGAPFMYRWWRVRQHGRTESTVVKSLKISKINSLIRQYSFSSVAQSCLTLWPHESQHVCKVIQPVHPKGDQSWVFIRRTDAEAETPVLWPPHAKSWLIGKDPDAGRDWGQEEKGMTEDGMAGWHHRLDGHKFE